MGKPECATCFFALRNCSLQRHLPPIKTAPAHRRQRTPRPRACYSNGLNFSCWWGGEDLNSFTEFPICHRTAFPTNQAVRPLYPGERSLTSSRLRRRGLSFPRLFFPEALLPCCLGDFDNSFDTLTAQDGAVSEKIPPPPLRCAHPNCFSRSLEDSVPFFPQPANSWGGSGMEEGDPKATPLPKH